MGYQPQPGYVMAQPLKKQATAAGLVLPPSEQDRGANIAEVLAVGQDLIVDGIVRFAHPTLEPGDLIAYSPFTDIEVEENEYTTDKLVFVAFDKIVAVKKSVMNDAGDN